MAMIYYYIMFGVALVLVVVYAFIFHKHFEATLTILVTLVPILNLAFVLMANATTVGEALVALRFTYIGGCFLLVSAMFLIFNICGVRLKPWMRAVIIAISAAIFSSTLTIGFNDMFYVGTPDLAVWEGASYITNKHYGFMHTVFFAMSQRLRLSSIAFSRKNRSQERSLFSSFSPFRLPCLASSEDV